MPIGVQLGLRINYSLPNKPDQMSINFNYKHMSLSIKSLKSGVGKVLVLFVYHPEVSI